jgi:uncharacterized protein (DUF488 family)
MKQLFTIGYEGTDIDRFLDTLKLASVEVLADVRAVAVSRKRGFSKTALRARLEEEGIQYLHFVELGDPKPGREAARAGRFAEFQGIYRAHLAEDGPQASLRRLAMVAESKRTCLLCFERLPEHCHRLIIAERLVESGVRAFDLYADYPARYVRHTSNLFRHDLGQGAAAAE